MNESIATVIFALGIIYAAGVAVAFAHAVDVRSGATLRRQAWINQEPEPTVAELEYQQIVGARFMLIAPFWPITLTALTFLCIVKVFRMAALQGMDVAASVGHTVAKLAKRGKLK